MIQQDQKLIADTIAEQSQDTHVEIEKMFLEADTRTPEQAKEKGLINDIREANVPEGAALGRIFVKESSEFVQKTPPQVRLRCD